MTDGVAVENWCGGLRQRCWFQRSTKRAQLELRGDRSDSAEIAAVRHMIHVANEMLVEQVQQIAACHALHHAKGRLARWLLRTHDYAGNDVLDLTQDFISEMIGVRRTTVTELAQTLQNKGFIKYPPVASPSLTARDWRSAVASAI